MLRSTWTNDLSKLGYPRPTFAYVLAALRAVRLTYAALNLRPCLSSILANQGTGYFTRCLFLLCCAPACKVALNESFPRVAVGNPHPF